jgi:hypothetical protein
MLADIHWFYNILHLLDGSLDRNDKEGFSEKMMAINAYVQAKSQGRCISKKLKDECKTSLMIDQLFSLYQQHEPNEKLCKSRFMRKLVKHNNDNNDNLTYILEKIVPNQIKISKFAEYLILDIPAVDWLLDLDLTIVDPEAMRKQRSSLKDVPEIFQERLNNGRRKIGESLISSAKKGWIDSEKIQQIIEGIQSGEGTEKIKLSKKKSVRYFTHEYRELVESGEDHKNAFRESLVAGLTNLKKDPVFSSTK